MRISKPGRLFVYVSIVVALIDALFVYMNIHLSAKSFEQKMQAESENLYQNYQTLLSQNYSNLLTIATFISSDPQVQQLFYYGKNAVEKEGGGAGGAQARLYRDQLFALVGDKWAAVQQKFSARQLHFHLGPGSTSFLRVHKREKYGDNMDDVRFTIVDTNQKLQSVTGFETGRVYSGLRGVVPVFATDPVSKQRVHVGALEVGTSFDVILNILNETSNYDAGVLLTIEHAQGAMWPEAYNKKFAGKDRKCGCVIEAASNDDFETIIVAGRDKGIRYRDGGHDVVKVDGSNYLISYYPVRDYLGSLDNSREDAGAIIFWKNIDESLNELTSSRMYIILYGIIGFVLIELLFFAAFSVGTTRLKGLIKRKTDELSISKKRLSEAQKIANVGNWEWEIASGELWWSDQVYKLFQVNPANHQPNYDFFLSFVHPGDRQRLEDAIRTALTTKKPYTVEHRAVLSCGKELELLEQGYPELDDAGNPLRMKGTVQDITALKHAKQRLSDVIWATGVGIWEWNVGDDSLSVNDRWAEMAGYSIRELSPLTFSSWEMLMNVDDAERLKEQYRCLLDQPGNILHREVRVRHRDGHWVWILVRGRCVERDMDGRAVRVSGSCSDITERKRSEFKIQRLATTDELTGLYNRTVFNQRLDEMIKLADRTEQSFCLMMIDLDGFKQVNDQLGHPIGDLLLRSVTDDLKSACRESDLVARLGGDEFAIILSSTEDSIGAGAFSNRLLSLLSKPKNLDGFPVQVSASIGFCAYEEAMTVEEMIKVADKAMYEAKRSGKNTYRSG